jgi:hypothetical protein
VKRKEEHPNIALSRKHRHEFLQEFLSDTDKLDDEIAECLKATLLQFLYRTRSDLAQKTKIGVDCISADELLNLQIKNLRDCIIDLERWSSSMNSAQGALQ